MPATTDPLLGANWREHLATSLSGLVRDDVDPDRARALILSCLAVAHREGVQDAITVAERAIEARAPAAADVLRLLRDYGRLATAMATSLPLPDQAETKDQRHAA